MPVFLQLNREFIMKARTIFLATSVLTVSLCGAAHALSPNTIQKISEIAERSRCATYDWKDRGVAPKAYMRGMALVFARAICHPERENVKVASSPVPVPSKAAENSDGLRWYNSRFSALGIAQVRNGLDNLRHTFTLLVGLGMRESTGQHCTGRDMTANFNTSDSAEAGLFQTSWGAHSSDPSLAKLFAHYKANPSECLLNVFSKGVSCPPSDWKNWGKGEGAEWQKLTKKCPAFAADYAAVVLRKNGGHAGEFGPIVRREAELLPACHSMLQDVQKLIVTNPELCADLK
jgi:hypothetical protein